MRNLFRTYRHSLYNYESVFPYAILGVVGGVASALIILAFDAAIVVAAAAWGVDGLAEDFESLPRWLHFALPAAGGLLLGLVFSAIKLEHRDVGIVHVLSRMDSHYGILPWRNALVQFVGGAFALATGQSGGREGPGVHLGAATNSLLGQSIRLPNNSLRVLIACGTAGGIAVAFNTPLAGVIFAMEVIVAEYTVIGFIPVILSAVSAMAISRAFDRGDPLIAFSGAELTSLWEVPFILLLGLLCGAVVALFIVISKHTARLAQWPVAVRFTVAGVVTGTLALAAPQ
ncbi:MAG: chloride channel protein, partial [Pseudomonadota bacterium]